MVMSNSGGTLANAAAVYAEARIVTTHALRTSMLMLSQATKMKHGMDQAEALMRQAVKVIFVTITANITWSTNKKKHFTLQTGRQRLADGRRWACRPRLVPSSPDTSCLYTLMITVL